MVAIAPTVVPSLRSARVIGKPLSRLHEKERSTLSDLPTVKLPPRMLTPVAEIICSLVLAWPAVFLMRADIGGQLWLAIAPLLLFAGALSFGAARSLACRQENTIEVSATHFLVFEMLVEREHVASVRRYVDLWFKGIRIDLNDGGWIKIPVHVHRPGKVLAIFDKYGYPVTRK